ncbi:MAG TPA: polyphosphate glucokinase [Bacteroidetes bacterium]|nr:polyphosphate glucokinase [Bacteroidota bacterium]
MIRLGIDIGGSGIKGVPINTENGEVMGHRHRIDTPQPAYPQTVADTVAEMIAHFKWHGPVGCTMPSIVQHGVTKTASNIPQEWIGVNAEALFKSKTGLDFKVINDADAAGMGELHFGAANDHPGTVLLLTVGTGIGSALFCNGVLIPNTELGHLKMHDTIAEKYCGDRARKEQKLKWATWAERFNEYIAHLELLFSPDMFIIGGGIANKTDKYWDLLKTNAKMVPATLKNNAGIVGAAYAAREIPFTIHPH